MWQPRKNHFPTVVVNSWKPFSVWQDCKNQFPYGKLVKTILRVARRYNPFFVRQTLKNHFPSCEPLKSLSAWLNPKIIFRVAAPKIHFWCVTNLQNALSVRQTSETYFLCGKSSKTISRVLQATKTHFLCDRALPLLLSLIPPSWICLVRENHSGKDAAKGDPSKKVLWNSEGTKLDNRSKTHFPSVTDC